MFNEIYIMLNNNDIAQISEGMTVRYDIAAMPRREFGEIAGQITGISTDIAIDQGMQGYFIVESEQEVLLEWILQLMNLPGSTLAE